MITNILTEEELCPITGHWNREKLKAWLQENHIPFIIAKSGWPRVHVRALERALGVAELSETKQAGAVEFNFDSLK